VECRPWLRFHRRRLRRSDMFLHISALQSAGIDPDNIRKGERLTFDVESTRDGKTKASNVRRSG
jgi:cold shock CspA family protein